jgi:triacylglycerol lipase
LFIFLHGFLGFVHVPFLPFMRYFRGLEAEMRRLGLPCLFPAVPKAQSVRMRAGAAAMALEATGDGPLVLVGHSMGGLDARYLAGKLDRRRRVQAVVTVATPHQGSPVAEWILAGDLPFPRRLVERWRPGLEDLTPDACARRNQRLRDRDDVVYLSCAAARPATRIALPLGPFARRMAAAGYPRNDGLVSVESAQWGRFLGVCLADHFELIGWRSPLYALRREPSLDHLALYRALVSQAAAGASAENRAATEGLLRVRPEIGG